MILRINTRVLPSRPCIEFIRILRKVLFGLNNVNSITEEHLMWLDAYLQFFLVDIPPLA